MTGYIQDTHLRFMDTFWIHIFDLWIHSGYIFVFFSTFHASCLYNQTVQELSPRKLFVSVFLKFHYKNYSLSVPVFYLFPFCS